jgi:hypothetical protein
LPGLLFLNFAYSNCAGKSQQDDGVTDLASLSGTCGEKLSDSARTPTNIDQVVALINQLPKPLALDCFIKALKPPLKVVSVNSPSSVQPAPDMEDPRIFIIFNKLAMAVVPKGKGKLLLEMSLKVSSTGSVKGEILFPVPSEISTDLPYSRILEGSYGTSCRTCHNNESLYAGTASKHAYQSNIITPLFQTEVRADYLKSQATFCNPSVDSYRCAMLKAVFVDGQAQDTSFP